jgi:hypothetical protein
MIFLTLGYSILLLLGCILLGHGVLKAVRWSMPSDGFHALFVRAVTGWLVLTGIYAVVMTSGNTVLWGLAVVGGLWMVVRIRLASRTLNADHVTVNSPASLVLPLLLLFGILLGFTLLHGILQFHTPLNNIQHFDQVYYVWLTSKMEMFGVESDDPLFAGPHSFPAMPYHYADLWLTGLTARAANVSNIIAYAVIVKSLFHALSVFGFLALARTYTRNWITLLFSLSAVIMTPVLLDYSHVQENACNLGQAKSSMASLFFIWMLYLQRKGSRMWYLPLLVLTVINIAFAPIVLPALVATSGYLYLRGTDRPGAAYMAVGTLAVAILLMMFYAWQPRFVKDPFSLQDDILVFFDLRYLAHMTYRVVANYVLFLPYLLPVLLFTAWKIRRKRKDQLMELLLRQETILAYTAMSILSGWAMVFLFWPFAGENASQMNTNSNFMLFSLLVVMALLATYEKLEHSRHRLLLTLFMGILFSYNIGIYAKSRQSFLFNPTSIRSAEYILQVSRYFEQSGASILGGSLQSVDEFYANGKAGSRSELMNGYWFTPFASSLDFLYVTSLQTLSTTYEHLDFQTLDLSSEQDRNYYWWIKKTEKALRRAPFTHFHQNYTQAHPEATEQEVQVAFAHAHGLGYVVTSGSYPLPELFIPMIDTLFIDGMSGEHFYFLQHPND